MELTDSSVTVSDPRAPWGAVTRVGFRIAYLFFACFILIGANGTLLGQTIPHVGWWIQDKLNWPFNTLTEWVGQHVFHLTGIAAHWHASDSGDTMMNWIHDGLLLVFAVVGGLVWTLIAVLRKSTRTEYSTLHAWLRFFLRLTCAMFMINYGLVKVFPFQMPPPSVAILTEPAGNMAPMTFLWNLIGLNPVYEAVCGSAEVIGGILLLYRRTSLVGALFSAFVITNVVLYNFCYDVPVKLFACNLLLALIFLALPDFVTLNRYFWSHQLSAPVGPWVPTLRWRPLRILICVIEIGLAVSFLGVQTYQLTMGYRMMQAAMRKPSPFVGAWHVDDGHPKAGGFVDPEGVVVTDLYVASNGRAYTRSADGELWLSGADPDEKAHTMMVGCYFIDPPTTYKYQFTDASHLVLTSVPPEAPKPDAKNKDAKPAAPVAPVVVTLTKTPTPEHYPLLERGFHLVSEWRYER